jgi:uncharacterized protein
MSTLKEQLQADLTSAMRARDQVRAGSLRMALTAVTNEEVSGARARDLSDAEVMTVLTREVKKRKEAAEAYDGANRPELADKERAESAVLGRYLPQQLSDEELTALVGEAVADVEAATGSAPTMRQMGQVVKAAQAKAAGRADGARVAAAVRSALS